MDECDNNDNEEYKLSQDEINKFIGRIYLGTMFV